MKSFTRALLYSFVFLTGAAGLIYQVVWQQYLSRIIGNEHAATALVLAIFLGGLAGGYLLSGALSRRAWNPLLVYAILEVIIALWAVSFPIFFKLVDLATSGWSFAMPWWMLIQGSFVTLVLILVPTLCMGGTVPLLTRAISESVEQATRIHARVYAINTLGAFVGALGAGFAFVPWLGLPGTICMAAWMNFGAATYFGLLARRRRTPKRSEDPAAETHPRRYPVIVLCLVAFLSGAYVMTLENVLIRNTDLALGPSIYSF